MDISFIQYLETDASVMKPHATRTIANAVIVHSFKRVYIW